MALTPPDASNGGIFTPSITFPDDHICYHFVEDKDLAAIMKISCPKSFVFFVTGASYIAGNIRPTIDMISKIINRPQGTPIQLTTEDFTFTLILVAIVVMTFISGLLAFFHKDSEGIKALKRIRKRPAILLNSDTIEKIYELQRSNSKEQDQTVHQGA